MKTLNGRFIYAWSCGTVRNFEKPEVANQHRAAPRSNHINGNIDCSRVEIARRIFVKRAWRSSAREPQKNGLQNVLGIFRTAGYDERGTVNKSGVPPEKTLQFWAEFRWLDLAHCWRG